tara:strand:- start:772 stop:3060 length:2289 start_codon:yes stop_codon:yes gene_type:complete
LIFNSTIRNLFYVKILWALITFVTPLYSQISAGGDALLKFGESKNNFNYSEVLLNMNIHHNDISNWFQFEFSEPPEIGINMNGLRKFRMDYLGEKIELSVGDIYKIWGRGLILNQFDDQDVDLDNGFRGLSLGFMEEKYNLNLLAGLSHISRATTDYWQNIDQEARKPNHHTDHSLFGGDFEIFTGPFTFAFSSLQSRENHPVNGSFGMGDSVNVVHRVQGFRGGFESPSLSGFVEIADKFTTLPEVTNDSLTIAIFRPFNGFSLFGNLNYYIGIAPFKGWSLTMEYKNYNTTKINPIDRNNYVTNYDMNLIFTQPPTVIREHSSVLLARLIPQVSFNDEVGYQASLVGPVGDLGYFTLNYQTASRTSLWEKEFSDSVNAALSNWWTSDSSVAMMPYTENVALPYNELYVEMEGYINKIRYQIGAGWTNKISDWYVTYNSGQNGQWDDGEPYMDLDSNGVWDTGESYSDYYSIVNERIEHKFTNAFTMPTLLNFNLGNGWSIDLKYEFQKIKSGTYYKSTLSSDEIFTDLDGDGIWDAAEIFTDVNENGIWDEGETTWYDWWLLGWLPDDQLPNYDTNGNGVYDVGEYYVDGNGDGEYDAPEPFTDLDGDGVWDDAEDLDDITLDDEWTGKGVYVDSVKTNFYTLDDSDQKLEQEFQNNHMLTIGLGKSPIWSLSLTIESSSTYEYGPQPTSITNPLEKVLGTVLDIENKWVALELMVNINDNTRLDLMYGTLRGGIICSNGICRYVSPFDDGFKLSLTSIF